MTAREIIEAVREDLNDPNGTRWGDAKMLGYLNRAQGMVAILRPDVSSTFLVVKLISGSTKQELPPTATLLLGITRNMGDDGETPGRPVTSVSQEDLDASNSMWHAETVSAIIYHFTYNEETPNYYFVTPVPADDVHVELSVAVPPVKATDLDSDLALPDIWQEAIMEWMKRCAYKLNASSQADKATGTEHERSFYVMLGDEARARLLASPNNDSKGGAQ